MTPDPERDPEPRPAQRVRRPEERPDEILGAAQKVFARDGLARARVDDIASEAGVSKGTIYLYFSGKDELFRTMVLTRMEGTLEGLSTSTGTAGSAAQRLRRFTSALWQQLLDPLFVDIYRMVLGELHQFPELADFYSREVAGSVTRRTAGIIEEGVADGSIAAVDAAAAARMVVGLVIQHAVWRGRPELFSHLSEKSDDEILEDIWTFVEAALLRSSGRRGADDTPKEEHRR